MEQKPGYTVRSYATSQGPCSMMRQNYSRNQRICHCQNRDSSESSTASSIRSGLSKVAVRFGLILSCVSSLVSCLIIVTFLIKGHLITGSGITQSPPPSAPSSPGSCRDSALDVCAGDDDAGVPSGPVSLWQESQAVQGTRVTELTPWTARKGGNSSTRQYRRFRLSSPYGMEVELMSLGATVTAIRMPGQNGAVDDVCLGFDNVDDYLSSRNPYFGATVGRVANRIENAEFIMDNVTYTLRTRPGQIHQLHGGVKGFSFVDWDSWADQDSGSVTFSYISKDGHEGFPGTLTIFARYSLSPRSGRLLIHYWGMCDKKTPVNLANHIYINLAGHKSGKTELYQHSIQINAAEYTPVRPDLIPTGDILSVASTPFDLRVMKRLDSALLQLPRVDDSPVGFDHNFVISRKNSGHSEVNHYVARLEHPKSKRFLEVYSNQPGVQFYTGNFLPSDRNESLPGKEGALYEMHGGLCLETQIYPNAVNEANFGLKTLLNPGELYYHQVTYHFGLM